MSWSWPERPRRVVVTGMGALTALGQDVASTWEGLLAEAHAGGFAALDAGRQKGEARCKGDRKKYGQNQHKDKSILNCCRGCTGAARGLAEKYHFPYS